jgi:hypothetical protein
MTSGAGWSICIRAEVEAKVEVEAQVKTEAEAKDEAEAERRLEPGPSFGMKESVCCEWFPFL